MSEVDLKRAYEVFLQAAEMATDQADVFIKAACGDDRQLLGKVFSLIKASQASDAFLEDMMVDAQAFQLNEIEDHCYRDRQFGPYQVLLILKQGGMGRVFLVRCADGEFSRQAIQADDPRVVAEAVTLIGENQRLMADHQAAEASLKEALVLLNMNTLFLTVTAPLPKY
jgi:hypothetical protein